MRSGNHHTNTTTHNTPCCGNLYPCHCSVVSGTQWHRGPFAGKRAPARSGAPTRHCSQIIRVSCVPGRDIVTATPRYPDIAVTLETTLLTSMDFNPQGGRYVTKPRSAGCRVGLIENLGNSIATKQAISTNPQYEVNHEGSDQSEQCNYYEKRKYHVAGHRHCTTSLVIEQTSPNAGLVD